MSVYESIFDKLSNDGFEVYSPSTKTGQCMSPYIVIKRDGGSSHSSFSTDIVYYTILIYVPQKEYSTVEQIVNNVKSSLKTLAPIIRPTGFETPSYYDDGVEAHMISVQYKYYIKQ